MVPIRLTPALWRSNGLSLHYDPLSETLRGDTMSHAQAEPQSWAQARRLQLMIKDPFFKHLQRHYPENPRTKVPDLCMNSVTAGLEAILEDELEESTWEGYARTWSEYERFSNHHRLAWTEINAALFLTAIYMDPKRKLSICTVYQYAKELSAVGNRLPEEFGWEDGTLKRVKRVLVKMGALIPESQALPMTMDDLEAILSSPRFTEDEKMTILLGWLTASRGDDLQKANANDAERVKVNGRWLIVVKWRPRWAHGRGSGRLKNSRNGLGHACVVDGGAYSDRLWRFICKRKNRPITDLTTAKLANLLQRINKELSGHSLKRGALSAMLAAEVEIALIIRVARHAHPLHDLPVNTKVYLPSTPLALALKTQDATRKILPPSGRTN